MNDVDTHPSARASVLVAYALFILVGVGAGVGGVLLLAQIRDYGVDQATIGLTFFTGSAGFVLAGATAGALIHRWGTRTTLLIGGGVFIVANAYVATRPVFVAFVGVQVLTGYGVGVLESALNVHLAALPRSTTLLNRLHAFFGVGALLGPLLATWMLTVTSWPMVSLVLAVACVPLVVAVLVTYPRERAAPPAADGPRGALLTTALRQRGVLLGAVLLTVYVGLEMGLGNWGFSYLVGARGVTDLVAGYTVSGYWLGLTLGRFLISPVAVRLGVGAVGQMYACMVGVAAGAALVWLLPVTWVASAGFVVVGFFLGPIFPTTMAIAPRLTVARLVPTAIGVINAGSVVGGSVLPWLAGVTAQGAGAWTLLPWTVLLALALLAVWWATAARLRGGSEAEVHDVQADRTVPRMVERLGDGGQDREPQGQVQVDG